MKTNLTPHVTTMAAFKRFLALPGATVQVIRNDWMDGSKVSHPIQAKPGYFDPKQVAHVQSNTVRFTTGSWLQFPKAAHVRFTDVDGENTMTIDMNQNGQFEHLLVYKLTMAPDQTPVRL